VLRDIEEVMFVFEQVITGILEVIGPGFPEILPQRFAGLDNVYSLIFPLGRFLRRIFLTVFPAGFNRFKYPVKITAAE